MSLLRPRFSLRSLLLGSLSLAATAALWTNFAPWRVEREYRGPPDRCETLTFSPDRKWILADFTDGESDPRRSYTSILWNVESGKSQVLLEDHWTSGGREEDSGWHYFSAFSADSTRLITGVGNGRHISLKLLNVESRSELKLKIPKLETIDWVRFAPGDQHLLFSLRNDSSQLIELSSGKLILDKPRIDLRASRTGHQIALIELDGSIAIYDTITGRELQRVPPVIDWQYVWIAHVSPTRLFVEVQLTEYDWNFDAENQTLCFDLMDPVHPRLFPGEVKNSVRNEPFIVIGSDAGHSVIDLPTLNVISRITAPPRRAFFIPISNNARLLCFGSSPVVYDVASGHPLCEFENAKWGSPSPDETRLVARDGSTQESAINIYDLSNGDLLQVLRDEGVITFAHARHTADSEHFITHNTKSHAIHLWTRHRPERWYGLAWLPEFWLLITLAATFLWSLHRDRKPAHAK